jgi:hypothetical protein
MADPKAVAKKYGVFETNAVQVEAHHVAPNYKLTMLDQNGMDPTGRLKVLRLSPSNEQAADPCFVGRWDEKANALDFDAADPGG